MIPDSDGIRVQVIMNNTFYDTLPSVNQTNVFNVSDRNNLTQFNLTLNISILRDIIKSHFFDTEIDDKTIALVAIYIPIFLLGILGNGAVLFIVSYNRRLRNITNLFLWNLALTDIAGESCSSPFVPSG